MTLSELLARGTGASEALSIVSLKPATKSRLPKWMVLLGVLTASKSLPAIRSLKNIIVKHTSPLPGVPTIGVSNLVPISKFFVCVLGSKCCAWWRKIYTGSGRMSLLPIIGGLRYRHH
jgi:hypothetical protein